MLHTPCHTFSGPLGPLTLNYTIIIYIKETNGWEPSQVKETKEVKETTLRLEPLECLEWVKEWIEQRHLEARQMLDKLPEESEKVYIIILIGLGVQPIDNKALTEGENGGLRVGQMLKLSSHLCLFCGLFIPYLGKICALFRGFIPLEKIA